MSKLLENMQKKMPAKPAQGTVTEASKEASVIVQEEAYTPPVKQFVDHSRPWEQYNPEGPKIRNIQLQVNDHDLELWKWFSQQEEVNPALDSTRAFGQDFFRQVLRKEANKLMRARERARKNAKG